MRMWKVISLVLCSLILSAATVVAADLEKGIVVVSVDDSLKSLYRIIYPVMSNNNLAFTAYVVTGRMGDPENVTWNQVQIMAANGVEIGSHSNMHPDFSKMTYLQIFNDLKKAQTKLANHSIVAKSLAYPFGIKNAKVVSAAKAVGLKNGRGAWDEYDLFNEPATFLRWWLESWSFRNPRTFADAKILIDEAAASKKCLSIVLHDVAPAATGEYQLPTAELRKLAKYLNQLQATGMIEVLTVTEAVDTLAKQKALP